MRVFISYHRSSSTILAHWLFKTLRDNKIETFIDVHKTDGSQQFAQRLLEKIEWANIFICVLSPETLKSAWVQWEIEQAFRLKKVCLPIFHQAYVTPSELPPHVEYLLQYDGARFHDTSGEFIPESFAKVLKIIQSTPITNSTRVPRPVWHKELVLARNFVGTSNKQWKQVVIHFREFEPASPLHDTKMCLVPVGSFMMGTNRQHPHYDNETDSHRVTIKTPYLISCYPITNRQWRRAVEEGVVEQPQSELALEWYNDDEMSEAPVVGISYFMVVNFLNWLNLDLPTEAEWEYAARGVSSLVYPWSNQFNASFVFHAGTGHDKPGNPKDKPENISWVGACHMVGNTYEWTRSLYAVYPYDENDGREQNTGDKKNVLKVTRGGSFSEDQYTVRAAVRSSLRPEDVSDQVGFRVVYRIPINS